MTARRASALIVAAVLATLTALLGGGVASAHSAVVGSNPADGEQIDAGPAQVSVTFNEALQTGYAALTVVGPDGNLWTKSDPVVEGPTVSADLGELGPAGEYTVAYRVTSADGHPVSGKITFTLTTGGNGTPGPAADGGDSGGDSGGVPLWPFVIAAVVVVAGGLWFALRTPRGRD